MYSPHNECNLVVAESFTQILKIKIDKILTANDSRSYRFILNNMTISFYAFKVIFKEFWRRLLCKTEIIIQHLDNDIGIYIASY